MASGEKVRWKSMAAIGGKLLDPFTLGIGKKATDMALELYFLGRDIQKRQAYFNYQSGKKTVKFKKFNLHLPRNNYFVRHSYKTIKKAICCPFCQFQHLHNPLLFFAYSAR